MPIFYSILFYSNLQKMPHFVEIPPPALFVRIEMELVLVGKRIEFSPTCSEVTDMIVSVVHEMNKLLREVPTIQSWITGASNQFVQVTLNKERNVVDMRVGHAW